MSGTRAGAVTRKRTVLVCKGCGSEFAATRSDAKWCGLCRTTGADGRYARFATMRRHPCQDCGLLCSRSAKRCLTCSNVARNTGKLLDKNPNWRGGRSLTKSGYVAIRVASGNGRGSRVLEHRYVWEQAHGPIPAGYHVHHLNGNKTDNRLENLVATSAAGHRHRERMIEPYIERIRQLEDFLSMARSNTQEIHP